MKLIFIRHGDPDYSIDSLTDKGWREARLLSDRLIKDPADAYYVSPLGRARDTASLALERLHRTAEVIPWLREFDAKIIRPDRPDRTSNCWDWLPQDWLRDPRFFREEHWMEPEIMADSDLPEKCRIVFENFDAFLDEHGYRREGKFYRAIRPNMDTLVFFCHFGLECLLLSRLLSISPMILWHGFVAAPTSVTTVATEERREGIASFRILSFGDTSHLYVADEPPAFAARFCECYFNADERH